MPDPVLRGELDGWLARHGDELVDVRRELHRHPELGRDEHRATSLLVDRLAAAGLAPKVLRTGTGLVCDVGYAEAAPLVGLRADIDALPVDDGKDAPYRSQRPGLCHACGHDVHTAVVLGAGLVLADLAERGLWRGRARLLFQPAEEQNPGGALDVRAEGALAGVSCLYALHCDPRLDVGQVGLREGPITAAADHLRVTVRGTGGHTSRPHLTTDVVHALASVVVGLPAALSRRVDPRAGVSVVFGAIAAGSATNVIPRVGTVDGTVRMLDREVWADMPAIVEAIVPTLVAALGAAVEVDYRRGVPPVVNTAEASGALALAVEAALGPGALAPTEQSLGGEDFAWYLEDVPGALARLGVRSPTARVAPDLHTPEFDVDERAIEVGVRVLAHAVVEAAAPGRLGQTPGPVGPVAPVR